MPPEPECNLTFKTSNAFVAKMQDLLPGFIRCYTWALPKKVIDKTSSLSHFMIRNIIIPDS
jgi:hypothetical protein